MLGQVGGGLVVSIFAIYSDDQSLIKARQIQQFLLCWIVWKKLKRGLDVGHLKRPKMNYTTRTYDKAMYFKHKGTFCKIHGIGNGW